MALTRSQVMGLEIMQKLGLHHLESNKDREVSGMFELRGLNTRQWVHRNGRAEKPNADDEATQSSAPARNCHYP